MALKNLFKALGNWWNNATDDAADAMKDPLVDHKLAIKASESKLESFRTRIAQLMASTAGFNRKLVNLESESKKFDNIARTAAEAGKEDDVREAVKLKQKVDAEITELTSQIMMNNTQVEHLRGVLSDGQSKVDRAKTDITALAARLDGARLREDMAKAESDFTGDGGMASIADLRKIVEHQEDVADAQTSLSVTPEAAVEKRLEDTYVNPQTLDADVAKYMSSVKK